MEDVAVIGDTTMAYQMSTTVKAAARPVMTASDATRFSVYSVSSELQVNAAIRTRRDSGIHGGCTCRAYDDVFTFNRWIAQGSAVVKGEKALHVSSFVPAKGAAGDEPQDAAAAGTSCRMIPKTVFLFCRCQVAVIPARVKK